MRPIEAQRSTITLNREGAYYYLFVPRTEKLNNICRCKDESSR